jgi:hypothetical protein
MKRKTYKNLHHLIIENRLEVENNPYELDKKEQKIEETHFKSLLMRGTF